MYIQVYVHWICQSRASVLTVMEDAIIPSESALQIYSFGAKSISHMKTQTLMCNVAYQHLNAPHPIATTNVTITIKSRAEGTCWMGTVE